MFVLLGPDFEGTNDAYQRLAQATGLVAYDLKSRLRPGSWGVLKALADQAQALALVQSVTEAGFHPVLVERTVAHDPVRRVVHVRSVQLRERDFVLGLRERDMAVDYGAIACLVRGEVLPGRIAQRGSGSGPSSATLRAAGVVTDSSLAREMPQSPFEAYQAADLHFLSVQWIARLDAHSLAGSSHEASPRALDQLVDELAQRAGVRVDRAVRTSSVVALAEQSGPPRTFPSEPPSLREARREHGDERFDAYSRVIGEAERTRRA
jgi:hypothetical protein